MRLDPSFVFTVLFVFLVLSVILTGGLIYQAVAITRLRHDVYGLFNVGYRRGARRGSKKWTVDPWA